MSDVTNRILRLPAVEERTGIKRVTIWRYERAGQFPRRRQIGIRAIGWLENEVDDWVQARCPKELEAPAE